MGSGSPTVICASDITRTGVRNLKVSASIARDLETSLQENSKRKTT